MGVARGGDVTADQGAETGPCERDTRVNTSCIEVQPGGTLTVRIRKLNRGPSLKGENH